MAKKVTRKKLLTRKELSELLGVVQDTITKWEQAGLPVAQPGRRGTPSWFDLSAVKKWLRDREAAARENGSVDLTRERARKERAQAIVAEQTFALRAAELLRRDDVEESWGREVAAIRAKLLSWPTILSDQIARSGESGNVQAVEKLLQSAVEELLHEFASGEAQAEYSEPKPRARARKKVSKKKKKPARKRTRA